MPSGSSTTKKTPLRMGQVFSHMLTDCPRDIQVYGKCVANLQGGINRHACEHEFHKLHMCFKRVIIMHKRRT
ncbi:unnamed protein product [Peronospora belbahrii]|uniref:CHCH domain-containing protein n=1 Tax=Peronospora belbahrii TaxID=622444 RepID=A0ABN8CK97_9STRA|nr:unnamed protein product [Peronospora belbahrii]